MKTHFGLSLVLATSLVLGAAASAHEATKTAPVPPKTASLGMPVYVQNIAPAAVDAVKVVDAFSAAIKAVKLDEATKLLDPKVLIFESGGSERSRDEYLREHAIADAAFMQTAQQQLRYRQAQADGDVAWVGTESALRVKKNGKETTILSTETMVLRKSAQGWTIIHIHWSSRPAPSEQPSTSGG